MNIGKIELSTELNKNNQKIYYSEILHNIKIVYIEKNNKNGIYYIFSYGGRGYENTYKKVHSNKNVYDLLDDTENKNTINKKICKIIKNRNQGLSDEKIILTKNRLLRSVFNLIKSDKTQMDIINIIYEDKYLFDTIYENILKKPLKDTNTYISNRVNIEHYSIYLVFNSKNNTYNLIIMENINNNINILLNNQKEYTNFNELTLNDTNLLMSWIDEIINNEENNYYNIINQLLKDIQTKISNRLHTDLNNTDILTFLKEKEIEYSKEKESIELKKQISFTEQDIKIILNRVHGKDENGIDRNPDNLNRSDLPEFLAKYLSLKYGLILRSNVNTPHLLNNENNCYELTDNEEILKIMANDFGDNTISMKEIKKALDYINNRLKPSYNIIRFNNHIYDMMEHKIIKLNSPSLPYYDIYFNYNPNAKGELIQKFLYSSLNEKQVKGLLELIGYLFTVGNKENIIICFIGKGGSGKSVLSNILRHIFKRVSNLPIHNLNKDHEISILENKLLNICNDTDNKKIKDNGTFKQLTGGDSLHINPKYRDAYIMAPEEVPYFIIVGNQFPQFENLEIPIIERLMLVEFKKGFRGTKKQNKNLYDDIIKDDDNIEWLIYNSLQAYKEIVINNNSFTLKKSTKENLDLYNKHSNSLKWIIKKLYIFDDSFLIDSDIQEFDLQNHFNNYLSVEKVKNTVLEYANRQGLDIVNDEGTISTKKLTNAIKGAFDLWELKDNYNYDYKPVQKRGENNNRFYVYPNLIVKDNN